LIQQGVRLWRHLADILGWREEESQGFGSCSTGGRIPWRAIC